MKLNPDLAVNGLTPEQAEITTLIELSPKAAREWIEKLSGKKMSKRNIHDWIRETISSPKVPAEGQGGTSLFSMRDIILMSIGIILKEKIGLNNHAVKHILHDLESTWGSVLCKPFGHTSLGEEAMFITVNYFVPKSFAWQMLKETGFV